MAVVEIARIQVRRGDARSTGMPQLETGEFGWAIQGTQANTIEPELYIGNKAADGASYTTNTRILTVLDLPNIFQANTNLTTASYTFKANQDPVILTTPAPRNLQGKLDEFVSLRDMNIVPSTGTFVNNVIQDALNDLYLNSDRNQPVSRLRLGIPPGEYLVSATIYVPPNTEIIGAGIDKSIITYINSSTAEPVFQFVDYGSTPGSYVTLNSMTSNGIPTNNVLSGMTIRFFGTDTVNSTPMIMADCLTDSHIEKIKFILVNNTGTSASNAGISVRGQGALTSNNLTIRDCIFENLYYGVISNYDTENTNIYNNRFYNLTRGIVFGENLVAGNQTGPKRAKIQNNKFNYIKLEGVLVTATNYTATTAVSLSDNSFVDVGNNQNGDFNPVTSVVNFFTADNSSWNDHFSRFEALTLPGSTSTFIPAVSGNARIIDNKIRSFSGFSSGTTSSTMLRLPASPLPTAGQPLRSAFYTIEYNLKTPVYSRFGTMNFSTLDSIGDLIVDDYVISGDSYQPTLEFFSELNTSTNTINVKYQGNTQSNSIITFTINQFFS